MSAGGSIPHPKLKGQANSDSYNWASLRNTFSKRSWYPKRMRHTTFPGSESFSAARSRCQSCHYPPDPGIPPPLERGKAVILDSDLVALYGVTVKRLNEQVRRNPDRFPDHFAFRLTNTEWDSLRSHNATLKRGQHRKYLPLVFTEHGTIMAATALNSPQAIQKGLA